MQNNYAKYTVEFAPAYFRKSALDIPARRLKDDTITDMLRKNIDRDIRVNKIIKRSLKQFCVLVNIPRHIAVKTGRFTSNHPYTVVSVCRSQLPAP